MKIFRRILVILLVVTIAGTIIVAAKDLLHVRQLEASKQEIKQQIRETNSELQRVNMRYRGFQGSLGQIPDSVTIAEVKTIRDKMFEYRGKITTLEREERDQTRLLNKKENALEEISSALRRRLLVLGGGAVVLLAGILLTGRAAIRS
jgi:septation ring formation regulator EzrA